MQAHNSNKQSNKQSWAHVLYTPPQSNKNHVGAKNINEDLLVIVISE